MPTFHVKHIEVPLFGMVEEQDPEQWLTRFSTAQPNIAITVTDLELALIADELQLDAEDIIRSASRYVGGMFRPNARGLGGVHLGDFGEVLAYLVNRADGRELVRVISWRAGAQQAVKGNRFPQPDFILRDGAQLCALEVKSTEALDYQDLFRVVRWKRLAPCGGVMECRHEALPQLGYVDGKKVHQPHELRVRDGGFVPFPVGSGVAVAVLVQDGRTRPLRGVAKYKTPPKCANASPSRHCWDCIGHSDHVVMTTMHNAPGQLSLAGSNRDDGGPWLGAYRRWATATRSFDMFAARDASDRLVAATRKWLDQAYDNDPKSRRVVRAFWGSYLGDVMTRHGLEAGAAVGELGDLSTSPRRFGWRPLNVDVPRVVETREADIRERMTKRPGQATERYSWVPKDTNTSMSLGITEGTLEFCYLARAWWDGSGLNSTDAASTVASDLIRIAADITGEDLPRWRLPMRQVIATVGTRAVNLGWVPAAADTSADSVAWTADTRHGWALCLATGDPRVRLLVGNDGRATLRIAEALGRWSNR